MAVEGSLIALIPWLVLPLLEVVYSVALMFVFNVWLALLGTLVFPLVLLLPHLFARVHEHGNTVPRGTDLAMDPRRGPGVRIGPRLLEEAVDVVLFNVGQDVEEQRVQSGPVGRAGADVRQRRQLALVGVVVVVDGEGKLPHIVHTLRPRRRSVADLLHRRQEQANEDRDDGNDHQQFDQGKAISSLAHDRSPK